MNSFVSPAGRALCLRKWMARLSAWKTRCWCHGLPAPSRRWRHSTYHVLEEAVEAVVAAAGGVSCTRFDRDRAAHRSAVAHKLSSSAAWVGGGARARRANCVAVRPVRGGARARLENCAAARACRSSDATQSVATNSQAISLEMTRPRFGGKGSINIVRFASTIRLLLLPTYAARWPSDGCS